jgi:hypothetical protein
VPFLLEKPAVKSLSPPPPPPPPPPRRLATSRNGDTEEKGHFLFSLKRLKISVAWEVRSLMLMPIAGCIYPFSEDFAVAIMVLWIMLVSSVNRLHCCKNTMS